MNLRLPTRREVLLTVDLRLCDVWEGNNGQVFCDTHPGGRAFIGDDMCEDAYHKAESILNLFRSRNGIPSPTVQPLDHTELSRFIQSELPDYDTTRGGWTISGLADNIAYSIIELHKKHEYPTNYDYTRRIVSIAIFDDARNFDASEIREELDVGESLAGKLHLYMRGLRK